MVLDAIWVDKVILLGYYMCEDIYKFNASKSVSDFNRQNNMCFVNFKHATSYMLGDCIQELYTAWRIAVCSVW